MTYVMHNYINLLASILSCHMVQLQQYYVIFRIAYYEYAHNQGLVMTRDQMGQATSVI